MQNNAPILRSLNLADLIDASVRLYRANFGTFFTITVMVYGPLAVIQVLVAYMAANWAAKMESASELAINMETILTDLVPLLVTGGMYGLMSLLLVPLAQGALTAAVSHRYLLEELSVGEAYGAIRQCWGSLIGATVLVGLVVAAGTMLCIIPGIYLGVTLMLVAPVIVIERATVSNAFHRSRWLVQGEWWHCFGLIALLSLFIGLIVQMVSWPVNILVAVLLQEQPALAQAISQGVGVTAGLLVQPIQVIGLVLLYYDLRVRKEGFDLQLLARALGKETPRWAAPPPPSSLPPPPIPGPYY